MERQKHIFPPNFKLKKSPPNTNPRHNSDVQFTREQISNEPAKLVLKAHWMIHLKIRLIRSQLFLSQQLTDSVIVSKTWHLTWTSKTWNLTCLGPQRVETWTQRLETRTQIIETWLGTQRLETWLGLRSKDLDLKDL